MDTFLLQAVRHELSKLLVGARLVRVYRAEERQFVFIFRDSGQSLQLNISLDPALPSVHLSERKRHAAEPGNFCALLKSRLNGAVLSKVEQKGMERVLYLSFTRRDELGRLLNYTLAAEVMPRVPNLILVDDGGTIIDAFTRKHNPEKNNRRIEPDRPYEPPSMPSKADPLNLSPEMIESVFRAPSSEGKFADMLVKIFFGLSPSLAREIDARAVDNSRPSRATLDDLWEQFVTVLDRYGNADFFPTIYYELGGERSIAITPFPFTIYAGYECENFQSPSLAWERFLALRQETGETRGGSQQVERLCRQFRKKLSVRRQALLSDIKETGRTEECRRKGELILANLKSTRKGMERISLVNLHEDGQGKVEVELDASLDGKANARRYFKLYNKLKNKKLVAEKRLKETDGIMEELEELFSRLGQGYEPVDVKERLEGLGLIWTEPGEGSKVVKEKLNVNSIIKHVDPQGWEILVGKNGRANDYLTTKVAGRDDIWLHVRGTPGAHVVIRNPSGKVDIPRSVLEKGARLAALNSRMKNASKATVDYTFRKHVRKPKGAPEGAVVIKKHKSITIFLDELDE